jgi:hypothetical protein
MGYTVKGTWKQQGEPDLKLFSLQTEKPYVVAVEVKSAEEKEEGQVGVGDIAKALAYESRVRNEFKTYEVIPLVISNRAEVSDDAMKDSTKSVRILLAPELCLLIDEFYALMEASWETSDVRERFRLMDKMITPQHLLDLFAPTEGPLIQAGDVEKLRL